MATLNKVMLIGRLIDNPEPPRTLPSGNTVIKFRFAVGRSRKNPQTGQWENDPNPLYIDCEAYSRPDTRRNLPELIHQFARKGDPLYIEGRLQLDQWEDKNGGGKRSRCLCSVRA
jgi:single-strand DNA-binding protein